MILQYFSIFLAKNIYASKKNNFPWKYFFVFRSSKNNNYHKLEFGSFTMEKMQFEFQYLHLLSLICPFSTIAKLVWCTHEIVLYKKKIQIRIVNG